MKFFWRWLDYKDASLFQANDLILDYDYYYGEDYDKNMTEIDDLHSTTSTYDAFTEATTETTSTATSTVTTIIETTQNLTSGKPNARDIVIIVICLIVISGLAISLCIWFCKRGDSPSSPTSPTGFCNPLYNGPTC